VSDQIEEYLIKRPYSMFFLEAQGKVPVSPSSVFVSDHIKELKEQGNDLMFYLEL
jgi:hypothetical protein